MSNKGSLGITTVILILSFLLIAATAASVIMNTSTSKSLSQDNINTMVNDAVDEISTYIQIKDSVGKYTTIDNEQKIEYIALLLKPMFTMNIDVSTLTVKLSNGDQVKILNYSGHAAFIGHQSLFEHSIWSDITEDTFSLIVVQDTDHSIVDFNSIDDHTDMAYLVIILPGDFALKSGDSLTVTLFPSTGITRTLELTAPLPMHSVVSFD